jgi:TatD DNase family protein
MFYDTHAHLDDDVFASELEQIVARAHQAGITKLISIGTDFASSERALRLSERFAGVYAVVGWHPNEAASAPADLRPGLRELARHPKVVALGEAGLDYYRLPGKNDPTASGADEVLKRKQAEIFVQQLEVASELGLNCVIHQRAALEDTLQLLEPFAGKVRGQFHCFADGPEAVPRILALGSVVSFTGILTFKNGENIRAALAAAPLGSFMLETDCPYLAPVPYRGKRCEPAYVKEIAEVAAQVKSCSLTELAQATCETAHGFFRNLA